MMGGECTHTPSSSSSPSSPAAPAPASPPPVPAPANRLRAGGSVKSGNPLLSRRGGGHAPGEGKDRGRGGADAANRWCVGGDRGAAAARDGKREQPALRPHPRELPRWGRATTPPLCPSRTHHHHHHRHHRHHHTTTLTAANGTHVRYLVCLPVKWRLGEAGWETRRAQHTHSADEVRVLWSADGTEEAVAEQLGCVPPKVPQRLEVHNATRHRVRWGTARDRATAA
jgi:hypothetical protein